MLGLEQWQISPEREVEIRAEKRKERWLENQGRFDAWLDDCEKTPKGYPRMSKTTAKQPIGILWLQVCASDGSAASVTYAANTDLSEADKLALLTSFLRLRVKGYHPSVLAQLCPIALLKADAQEAITNIPKVTESEPEIDAEQGFDDLAISLGLT